MLFILLGLLFYSTVKCQEFSGKQGKSKKKFYEAKNFVVPSALATYGFIARISKPLQNLNYQVNKSVAADNKHVKVDNYLQYSPAMVSLGLSASGLKGRHGTIEQAKIFLIGNLFNTVLTQGVKHTLREIRPDSSAMNSYPSGHTSTAFCNAELLRLEYGQHYPLLAAGGYIAAISTGYLRMYNQRHWLSDIIGGAGFGLISARLGYNIYPKIFKNNKRKKGSTVLMPYYNSGSGGFSYIKIW